MNDKLTPQDYELVRKRVEKGEDVSHVIAELIDGRPVRKAELLGVNPDPHPMSGQASDLDPSPEARQAAMKARALLAGYEDHPQLASVIGDLQAIGADPDKRYPGDVRKAHEAGGALAGIWETRAELAKADAPLDLRERLEKAERDLEREYLGNASPVGLAKRDTGLNCAENQRAREMAGLPALAA